MAHGIKQGILGAPLRGMGNACEKAGVACTAGKELLPMLSENPNPKIAFA
jgi:hypothetical protein